MFKIKFSLTYFDILIIIIARNMKINLNVCRKKADWAPCIDIDIVDSVVVVITVYSIRL